jgi:hypothetical protein
MIPATNIEPVQLELPFFQPRLTYQWLANGVPIPGATEPVFCIPRKYRDARITLMLILT